MSRTETTSRRGTSRPRWLAILLAVALFAMGLATGVAADRLARGKRHHGGGRWWHERDSARLTELFRDKLDLTDEQAASVEGILRRRWQRMAEVFLASEPRIEAIREQADQQIRALLTEEQRRRFEAMKARVEKRRAAMRRHLQETVEAAEGAGPGGGAEPGGGSPAATPPGKDTVPPG